MSAKASGQEYIDLLSSIQRNGGWVESVSVGETNGEWVVRYWGLSIWKHPAPVLVNVNRRHSNRKSSQAR